jgi:glycerophosphoryl diester phosphodiesterase
MDYAEILRYDVGLKPHPRFPKQHKIKATKPLLEDIIDSVNLYMTTAGRTFPFFNIETKTSPAGDGIYHPAPPEFVERLMAVIQARKLADNVIIQSFDFRTLQYLHQHYPAISTAMLIEDYDKRTLQEQLTALGFTPSIYSPHYSLVTPKLLTACHRLGIKVIPWTVNEKQTLDKLKEMGSDGVITDYPDLVF